MLKDLAEALHDFLFFFFLLLFACFAGYGAYKLGSLFSIPSPFTEGAAIVVVSLIVWIAVSRFLGDIE